MMQHSSKMRKRRRKTSKEERVCSICSQSFNKAEHLLRHIRSHTKEKPFECNVCGRMYARQDTLLRHSRSHQTTQGTPDNPVTDQDQYAILNQTVPISPPNSRSIDGSSILETVIAGESSNPSPSTGTGLTAASDFGIASLDADGIRQCDLLPYWNFEDDPQRPYFDSLLSNNMDLGDLNMSLLNTATVESLPQMTTGDDVSRNLRFNLAQTSDSFTPDGSNIREPDSIIQRSWHTYCSNSSSGYVTPDPGQDQYAVDEDCHRELVDKLQPRLQPGTLPSTSFLDHCVQAYLCHFHPLFPIIHAPSFRPHSQNGLLLLSMCSVGSLFIGSSRATAHGISMFERLHKAILSTWDTILSKSESVSHKAFQASVIGQMFGILVGRPKDLMQVELFHGTMVVWARKLKLFRLKALDVDLSLLDGQALDQTWKTWIRQEERRRTTLGLLLQDAEIARLFHDKPIIRQSLHQLPVASSNEAFAAEDAITWRNIMLAEASNSLNLPDQWSCNSVQNVQLPDVRGTFGLYVLLERIGAAVSDNIDTIVHDPEGKLPYRNMLVLWHEKYRNTSPFQLQERHFMILWHSIFMLLNSDLDMLEIAAGRDGTDAMNNQKPTVEAWARSTQAKKCMAHSMLLQQQFERIPLGSEPPLHAAACLFRCGIIWYCYGRYGGGTSSLGHERTEMPELEYLGIDGDGVLRDQVSLLLEKPLEATLLLIVDLLRRISHWKVADRFASTLLALVDDGQGLY